MDDKAETDHQGGEGFFFEAVPLDILAAAEGFLAYEMNGVPPVRERRRGLTMSPPRGSRAAQVFGIGYVSIPRRIFKNGVTRCLAAVFELMMSNTSHCCLVSASAMSDR